MLNTVRSGISWLLRIACNHLSVSNTLPALAQASITALYDAASGANPADCSFLNHATASSCRPAFAHASMTQLYDMLSGAIREASISPSHSAASSARPAFAQASITILNFTSQASSLGQFSAILLSQ